MWRCNVKTSQEFQKNDGNKLQQNVGTLNVIANAI